MTTDEHYMNLALKEAQKALEGDEVPVGAIVVVQNRIISKGWNQVELLNDSTAHAEIIALTAAFNYLGSKYLPDATLYVTLEPCLMCCGALYWSNLALTTKKMVLKNIQAIKTRFIPKPKLWVAYCRKNVAH